MKKQLLNVGVAFATTLFLAGGVLAQHEAPVRSEQVPHVKAGDEIVIDGVADEDSYSAESGDFEKFNAAGVTSESDFSGYIKFCYDETNLYLFANIVDDVEIDWPGTGDVHAFDCIEVFQDLDTSIVTAAGVYITGDTADQAQWRFNRGIDTITGNKERNDVSHEFVIVNGATGWTIEASLPWLAFMPNGSTEETVHDWLDKALGFDCQLADNDATARDGQFMWDADVAGSGTEEDYAWKDTRTFGIITLETFSAVNPVTKGEFGVYPNPASNVVNFKNLDGVTSIEIVNAMGQLVKIVDVSTNTVVVNTSDLATGAYFARMITSKGVSTVKFAVR